MLVPRIMPCLLVNNGRLVKTVKFKKPQYIGDPVNAIKIYNEKEVDELIVVDISATKEKRGPNFDLVKRIADECFMPLCYGGGIDSVIQMRKLFKLGIEKVALNSHAFNNVELIRSAANEFGNQSIIASIDVRKNALNKYKIYTHSGSKLHLTRPQEYAKIVEDNGAGEILLNSINRDGTWDGFDIELIRNISESVSIPVIAVGGAGSLEHIKEAILLGKASATAIGSMAVFQGKNLGVLINFPTRDKLIEYQII